MIFNLHAQFRKNGKIIHLDEVKSESQELVGEENWQQFLHTAINLAFFIGVKFDTDKVTEENFNQYTEFAPEVLESLWCDEYREILYRRYSVITFITD